MLDLTFDTQDPYNVTFWYAFLNILAGGSFYGTPRHEPIFSKDLLRATSAHDYDKRVR